MPRPRKVLPVAPVTTGGTATLERPTTRHVAASAQLEFSAPSYRFIAAQTPMGYIAQMKSGSVWMGVEAIPVAAIVPWLIQAGLLTAPTGMGFSNGNGGVGTTQARRGPIPKTGTISRV